MRTGKILFSLFLASALLAASASAADARGWRRGPGPVLGLVGAAVVGAATIATLPFAVLADATRPAPPPPAYYGYRGYDYPPPPPPRYYRYYGPRRGYYGY